MTSTKNSSTKRDKRHKGGKTLPLLLTGAGFGTALGVALGSLVLAPAMNMATLEYGWTMEGGPSEEDLKQVEHRLSASDSVVAATAPKAVAGQLKDQPILVMATADATEADVSAVQTLLKQAGAKDAGFLQLKENFFAQEGADSLKTLVANALPAGAKLSTEKIDSGTHSGQALAAALGMKKDSAKPMASETDRAALLGALESQDFVSMKTPRRSDALQPARAVVLVTGDSAAGGNPGGGVAANNQAAFAEGLDSSGLQTVVLAPESAAEIGGVLTTVREDKKSGVSTVDGSERAAGRVAAVLAASEQLTGKSGHYGSADSATAVLPSLD